MQVSHLSYALNNRLLFSNISFNTDDSPLVVIEGKNGSGKSTLLKVILGLIKPTSGQVSQLPRVGYVPDSSAQYFVGMSPRILFHFLEKQFHLDSLSTAQVIAEFQEQFALSQDLLDTQIQALSLGEKKKVMLTAAWLLSPDLFVMDEPFSGLDAASLDYLLNKIETERQEGRQFIIVTHEQADLFSRIDCRIRL